MRSIPLARLWAFLAILVVTLAAALREAQAPAAPQHPAHNGIAIAYARGPFARDFSLAATLTLERSPRNQSWYCDWLMLVAHRVGKPEQPMVQAGLMRWARNDYRLSAFFALGRDDGRPIHYEDLAVLSEGPHHVVLRARAATLRVLVDGRELRTLPLSTVFKRSETVYAQIAGEVFEPGDTIAGTLEQVVIARDGEARPRPYDDECKRYDRGLRLDGPNNRLAVSGTFDVLRPSGYLGCRNFFGPDR